MALPETANKKQDTQTKITPNPKNIPSNKKNIWPSSFPLSIVDREGNEVVFSSEGDAGPHNTHGFGQSFLGPIAENRAFVRCVRNFLKINVVAQDEIAVNPTAPKPMQKAVTETVVDVSDPKALLSKLMGEKGVTFAHIKKKLEQENYTNAENFATVNDIPNIKIFELLDRIQKIKKA